MKREILFKAKRVDNKKWIEGYHRRNTFYNKLGDEPKEIYTKHFIGAFSNIELFDNLFEQIEVYPETVCQFIGLTDKNGIKIFEGDLIRWGMDNQEAWIRIAKVIFNPDIKFEITHYIHGKTKEVKESDGKIFKYGNFLYNKTDSYVEIIGNIHD